MKILMVTGSLPPDACGVGDYTGRLLKELRARGIDVEALKHPLRLCDVRSVCRLVAVRKPDLVHVQYPTVGFANRLGPHFFSLCYPGVVTLHEVSQLHLLKRISLVLFSLRSRHILFTTHRERDYACQKIHRIGLRSSVIPVGSSIPIGPEGPRDLEEVAYFGLIRPRKGLEDFRHLGALIKDRGLGIGLRIIGSPDPRKAAYFEGLKKDMAGLRLVWDLGLSEEAVARTLARTRVAYMPYPDGASEYRTSLLALLVNGVAVVTTRGERTPPELEGAVEFATDPAEALEKTCQILKDDARRAQLQIRGREFAAGFSWESIVQKHLELYESILRRSR